MKTVLQIVPIALLLATPAQAQITAAPNDAGTIVQPLGNTIEITGGTIGGRNLFHSFQKFGLDANQTANFLSNPSVQNILGRVVGGDASVINGRIQVTGGAANLYLINPAGIVFGAGSSLNLPGSFTATTANGIGFGNQWLSAIGSNSYAALTGNPTDFAFTTSGAILNAGNLAVQSGQSLMLLGGTVISTGTLTAPDGQVTIAAIPHEKLVRVSQTGSLLSLDLPLETKTALNPLPYSPVSLPELLTIGGMSISGAGVAPGDGMVTTIATGRATLQATRNLTLLNSQIETTGDLNLRAGQTVQIQDSPMNSAVVRAGGSLEIQGDRSVEIALLSHPQSRLASGGDLVIWGETIVGDAHYSAGGNLRFERLDGSAGSVFSPHDPVLLAIGNVTLGDYTGASLHILAGGSVSLGNVRINALGSATETINPTNANLFNGSRELRSLSPITRADGSPLYVNVRPTLDAGGNIQRLPQTSDQLKIDGSTNTTLDVRSGVDWAQLGGLGTDTTIGALVPLPTFSALNRADITIASIQVNRVGSPQKPGVVLLTNQFAPTAAAGSIQVNGNFRVTDAQSGTVPNTVVIDSRGTIATGDIQSRHGSVDLNAIDNITAGLINASALDFLGDDSVVLVSRTGNIEVATISAGANGLDIRAGRLFRVTDTKTYIGSDPFPGLIKPGTELGDFLISKGYAPDPNQRVSVYFVYPTPNPSIVTRPTNRSAGVLNAPISISYGDGATLITDQTFPIIRASGSGDPSTASVGRIVIRGGGAAFYSMPRFDPVVPGAGPFITGGGTAVPPVPIGTTSPPPSLRRNATNFQPGDLPVGVSGTVGIIAISSGSDSGFYGSTLAVQFLPPSVTPSGETGGNPGGTGGNPGGSTPSGTSPTAGETSRAQVASSSTSEISSGQAASISTQEGQSVQQDLNKPSKTAACIASIDRPTSQLPSVGTDSQPNRAPRPCGLNPADDAQILKILEDAPAPERIKALDFDRLPADLRPWFSRPVDR